MDASEEIPPNATIENDKVKEATPGRPPLPSNVSNISSVGGRGRKRSMVWDHFTRIKIEDSEKPRAACNYCGIDYACDSKNNGTKSMLNHLEAQCKTYPLRNMDKTQTTLGFKPKERGGSSGGLVPILFSVEACRQALAEMLILDELPFRFVEGEGFRRFMLVVQPRWVGIPSRMTIAKDCFNVYLKEKSKLRSALKGQRISLTTDTWTSVQNLNYMCLTAHFIDCDWKLHKRILNFCLVENHKGETLGKAVEMCLIDWGRPKMLTITLDNASSNNGVITFLKRKTKSRNDTILEHEFLHMRCCAHILNLVVRDGFKEIDQSIVKVRSAVKYVKSSPQRWSTFKLCAEKEAITCKSHVCLDVPTRWNSTYFMLDRAEKFQKAFERLEEDDVGFLASVGEEDSEDDEDGTNSNGMRKRTSRKLGPPDSDDWEKARLFVKFLKLFHDATLRFSGSNYVTCNSFFMELVTIQDAIDVECEEGTYVLRSMATSMKDKFEKYWGNFENMNLLLYVGLVLDPRYKLRYLDFCLQTLYANDAARGFELMKKVKDAFTRLYNAYIKDEEGGSAQQQNTSQSNEELTTRTTSGVEDRRALRMSLFKKHLEAANSLESKSEVDRYLAENCEDDDGKFDLLDWWKVNSVRYRVLSKVARHVLAIPVSTVASESAFSTAGRVLDPFRSSLSPTMVEALICAQNWLRSSSAPISLRNLMDDVEDFEKLDIELVEEVANSSESISTLIDDD